MCAAPKKEPDFVSAISDVLIATIIQFLVSKSPLCIYIEPIDSVV